MWRNFPAFYNQSGEPLDAENSDEKRSTSKSQTKWECCFTVSKFHLKTVKCIILLLRLRLHLIFSCWMFVGLKTILHTIPIVNILLLLSGMYPFPLAIITSILLSFCFAEYDSKISADWLSKVYGRVIRPLPSDSPHQHLKSSYRLPYQGLDIAHYKILVTPYFEGVKTNTFDGQIDEAKTNPIDEIFDFWTINFDDSLPVNDEVKIEISYNGILHNNNFGFYKSYYKEDGKIKWLATTQFEPTHARKAFPCFDEPQYKSRFTISVRRPKHFKPSLSNMKMNGPGIPDGDFTRETFHTTPLMSTYLIAFIISELEPTNISSEHEKNHFAIWARPGAKNQGNYAFNVSKAAIKHLGEYFDLPFSSMDPNLKIDHVSMPDFNAGAMENWGLVIYREPYLMYEEGESSARNKQFTAGIMVHESAHFWFGDLVTCRWWSETWLNEGFAEYFNYHITDKVDSMNLTYQFNVNKLQSVLYEDQRFAELPLTNPNINSPEDIKRMFSPITYDKGSSIIKMMCDFIGPETFRLGVGRYLKEMKYKSSLPEDLFRNLQAQADIDRSLEAYNVSVADFMISWTEQDGFPLISVFVDRKSGIVKIAQKRFLRQKHELWYVPITWSSKSNLNFDNVKPKFIMKEAKHTLEEKIASDDWIVLNIQQSGYYRINYDNDTWWLLSKALSGEDRTKIHPHNRAQIVNDVFQLTKENILSYKMAYNILKFLEFEDDYAPWAAAFDGFKRMRSLTYSNPKLCKVIKKNVLKLIEPLVKKVGFEEQENENHLQKLFRMEILNFACLFQHEGCYKQAKILFENYKKDPSRKIHKNAREFAYCYGIKQGNEEDFELLWKKYLSDNLESEKFTILISLGCSNVKWKLEKLLLEVLSVESRVRLHNRQKVLDAILIGDYSHVQIVYEFIFDNVFITREALGNEFTPMIINVIRKMNLKQLENMESMLNKNIHLTYWEMMSANVSIYLRRDYIKLQNIRLRDENFESKQIIVSIIKINITLKQPKLTG
ncbi:membrane alanyl aminopeptidase-like [Arctopsyche grandis]|uniref:membrane alanyl aminopeptidase-like n=1 Tax=Arctopsyche grandis TaxID=121162 RepID=UPI00406D9B4B